VKFVKAIRDPVHGWIRLTDVEVKIIDELSIIQRLRYVRQLGFVYLVYPTASHTRFDHTLGVMHLSYLIGRELLNRHPRENPENLLQHLRIAALIHDIGHYPFSHTLEPNIGELIASAHKMGCGTNVDVSRFETSRPHEVTSKLIFDKIKGFLESLGLDVDAIYAMAFGGSSSGEIFSNIITGTVDADRLDYIMRDMYFTGAAVGSSISYVDLERMISSMSITEDGIAFDEKARVHLEGYVITRYNLYRHVYLHHKTVLFTEIARSIFSENMRRCIEGNGIEKICKYLCELVRFACGDIDEELVWKMTDDYFISIFSADEKFKSLIARKQQGYLSLWKRDKDYMEIFGDDVKTINAILDNIYRQYEKQIKILIEEQLIDEIKRYIQKYGIKCNLDKDDVKFAYVSFDPRADDVYISTTSGRVPLEKLSPLVQAVKEAWERSPHFFIYIKNNISNECLEFLKKSLSAIMIYILKSINLFEQSFRQK